MELTQPVAFNPINGQHIARFYPSFDGKGYLAVGETRHPRLRWYSYGLCRIKHFTTDGTEALVVNVDDDSGGFVIADAQTLMPLHELPQSYLTRKRLHGWPSPKSGGMKQLLRNVMQARGEAIDSLMNAATYKAGCIHVSPQWDDEESELYVHLEHDTGAYCHLRHYISHGMPLHKAHKALKAQVCKEMHWLIGRAIGQSSDWTQPGQHHPG